MSIEGWMSERELTWIAEQAKKHYLIVEIGSWNGRSTRAFGDNTRGTVYAVDDWRGVPKGVTGNTIRSAFHENLRDLLGVKIFNLPMSSELASKHIKRIGRRPDMVFIDGGHKYTEALFDIRAWSPLLIPGGLLCGHDYAYAPVASAVAELPWQFEVVPETSIWWSVKP